jgi:hypothetical protein
VLEDLLEAPESAGRFRSLDHQNLTVRIREMKKFDKPKGDNTQQGFVMQGMFPYTLFSRERRKY